MKRVKPIIVECEISFLKFNRPRAFTREPQLKHWESNRPRGWHTYLALMVSYYIAQSCGAAAISVGTHVLLPNTPNQNVWIYVTGSEPIAGEEFFAQIGDGGAFIGGTNTKPVFASVDIINNSIFAANNNGTYGDPNGTNPPGSNAAHPLIWVDGTTTSSGTVVANGQLAKLNIDTTGLSSGFFPLLLSGVANSLGLFNTTLYNANGNAIALNITNGSLIVAVPTPGDFNLNGAVDAADYVVWRRGLGTTYTPSDFNTWHSHFAQAMGSGSFVGTPTPEPTPLALLMIGTIGALAFRAPTRQSPLRTGVGIDDNRFASSPVNLRYSESSRNGL